MSLLAVLKTYYKGYDSLIKRAEYIRTGLQHEWIRIYATEALISESWQLWNDTCQKILLKSCCGCTGRGGTNYPSRPNDNSLTRIAYEVKQYGNRQKASLAGKAAGYWDYPTWGDGNKIISVIAALQPSNATNLLTAFGLPLFGHKHLQILRNFTTHKSKGSLGPLKMLSCFAGQSFCTHPSCYIWEYCNSENSFYYYIWMSDMRHIIYQATL